MRFAACKRATGVPERDMPPLGHLHEYQKKRLVRRGVCKSMKTKEGGRALRSGEESLKREREIDGMQAQLRALVEVLARSSQRTLERKRFENN